MAGPWDKYKTQVTNPSNDVQGPWSRYKAPTGADVLSGKDPLYEGLNEQRSLDEQALPAPETRQTRGLRSHDDLYGAVNREMEQDTILQPGERVTGDWDTWFRNRMNRADMARERAEQEKQEIYNKTGTEESFLGYDYRVQNERVNNPNFDPTKDEDPVSNPAYLDRRYLVDKPNANVITRIGQQLAENIIGGVGDFVTEGKLLTEGKIGQAIPDVVPEGEGEKLVTELTTFIVGPGAVSGALKGGAKALGVAGKLTGQVANSLSPEALSAVKSTYDGVLKATGSAQKAFEASNKMTRGLVIGMSMGLKEGIVAPDDSTGLIPPEAISEAFGVGPERARDIAFMLDTPVIGATLSSLGALWNVGAEKLVKPTFGGLRNISPLGINVGDAVTRNTINEKRAGLKVLTWLDPNLSNSSPEDFIFKTNVLAGAMDRKAVKNVQLAGAQTEVAMDTPAAFVDIAKDYYSQAYSHLKDALGTKDFNEWVSEQAAETSNRLFELRTAIVSDATMATKTSQTSARLEELFRRDLPENQQQAGDILGGVQTQRLDQADAALQDSKTRMEQSQLAAERGISDNPEIQEMLDEYANTLGSTSDIERRLKENVTEPMYNSFKKMKTDTDAAYKKISDSGAEGDANSILEIIGPEGAEDSVFKNIAESVNSDSSFKNIYNNVRKTVSDEISKITKSGNDPYNRLETLKALRKNISEDQLDWLRTNGDGDVAKMADEAKAKFIDFQTAWRDDDRLKPLGTKYGPERLRGEDRPMGVGIGQGVSNWDNRAVETVRTGLEGMDSEGFMGVLDRAAKAGGEDVAKGVGEYYASKSLSNLANRVASGSKETAGTMLQSVKSYINILDNMGSPLVEKYKKLEVDLQTLANTAKADEKSFEKVSTLVEQIKKEANVSVLNKFIAKNGGRLGQSDVDRTIRSVFSSPQSENEIRQLLTTADGLGDDGVIVKDALRDTYLDYLRGKIFTNRSTGVADIKDGLLKQGYKANEINMRKILEPHSKEMGNLRLLFADTPEVFEEFRDVAATLQNITKTTTKSKDDVLKGGVDKDLDPSQGFNALINFWLGPLNRTSTKVKNMGGPLAAKNLAQVKEAQEQMLLAMMTDPKQFAKIARDIGEGVMADENRRQLQHIIARGAARTAITDDVENDMDNLR